MDTPKTDDAVALVLTRALEASQTTGEFVKEQLPDVVQQLLIWNLTASVLTVVTSVVFCLCFWRGYVFSKKSYNHDRYSNDGHWMFWIIGGALSGVSIGIAIANLFNIAKILVAPKVWLLEYAANLLK